MAAPKNRIYALNLGTQTITLAEFQTNPSGGVTLVRYKKSEILGDPNADSTRVAQTKLQIDSMAQEFGIHGGKANYAIASHVIFTRPVRLPSVGDASQVEQIIGFEAAQNVPYPIEQVVWDWQLLDEGKGGQMEVILAAIKSDLLDEINSAVEDAKFTTGVVEIAPMALYNSLRYNYADEEGCTLLVDIGSRTTNLLFCEPGKIFPRRLNIGGSTITTALAKDLQAGFSDADHRKVDVGFVSLGGTYAEPDDPEIARISKIIRNQMTRLHQEIARSITFYRSEHGGAAPSRVLLAGGTASLPYMREFFQEKFAGIEVQFFNPLRNVSVDDSLDLEDISRDAHTLGEVIGLALRGAGSCPMELNLRPASVVAAERVASQRPFMIAAGAVLLAGLAGWWQYNVHAAQQTRAYTQQIEEQKRPLAAIESKISASQKEAKKLTDFAKPLVTASGEREYWAKALADLNACLPEDYIWITVFEPPTTEDIKKLEAEAANAAAGPRKPGAKPVEAPAMIVNVKGILLGPDAGNNESTAVFDRFIENLNKSNYFVPPAEGTPGYERPTTATQDWGFKFAMPLKLKNPIDLK